MEHSVSTIYAIITIYLRDRLHFQWNGICPIYYWICPFLISSVVCHFFRFWISTFIHHIYLLNLQNWKLCCAAWFRQSCCLQVFHFKAVTHTVCVCLDLDRPPRNGITHLCCTIDTFYTLLITNIWFLSNMYRENVTRLSDKRSISAH